MKYKISDVYVKVNGENIAVGTVLGQEDQPESSFGSIMVTNSEYDKGLKNSDMENSGLTILYIIQKVNLKILLPSVR